VEKRHYNVESLTDELRRYEARYGLTTAELVERYADDDVPATVPRYFAFAWASTSRELARLCGPAPAPQFA
jgi:hypothetical protein